MRGDKGGLVSGGMKCEAGRLLAWDWAGYVDSVGAESTGEVACGTGVVVIARLLRNWVRLDVYI